MGDPDDSKRPDEPERDPTEDKRPDERERDPKDDEKPEFTNIFFGCGR